jgi:primosomal protein N' (replication factor Y)
MIDVSGPKILSVAIPRPLDGLFTYRIPEGLAQKVRVGSWIRVPFGRATTHAFVVEPPRSISELPPHLSVDQLREISETSEAGDLFTDDVFKLCQWAHEYYAAPLGEVLNCAAPSVLFKSKAASTRKTNKEPTEFKISETSYPKKQFLLKHEQESAVEALNAHRTSSHLSKVALLEGVTGSGKTEVYIEVAKKTLIEGKGVLILVPEIALTPQLHARFEQGLGVPVALWHSAVSAGKRKKQFEALKRGVLNVVVGARSAVFAPIRSLGLIVVDEEHDITYKQEDRVRYHARDLAIVRGKLTGALVVLGSATPSLETRERVREGRYAHAQLTQRIAPGGMPQVELIDLKVEERIEEIQAPLARRTVEAIQKVIDAGEQVIVYLNRRGFAAFLLCQDCGEVKGCPRCSISLTLHKKKLELRCHVCGFHEPIPMFCDKCQGTQLDAMGAGTESLELDIPKLISGAKVLRLDRDQITSSTRLENLLEEFRSKSSNILLGTQMLVKGHDFPGVTLVVVILADALFRWPDFRAPERALQILKQVSGRSGRGEKLGRVLIQTYDPEHAVLNVLEGKSTEESFLENEREMRQVLGYPPFGRIVRMRIESSLRDESVNRANSLANYLRQTLPFEPQVLELLGPSEAFLEKVNGVFRWDLLIKSKNIQGLQKTIYASKHFCATQKWPIVVDVDPLGM